MQATVKSLPVGLTSICALHSPLRAALHPENRTRHARRSRSPNGCGALNALGNKYVTHSNLEPEALSFPSGGRRGSFPGHRFVRRHWNMFGLNSLTSDPGSPQKPSGHSEARVTTTVQYSTVLQQHEHPCVPQWTNCWEYSSRGCGLQADKKCSTKA